MWGPWCSPLCSHWAQKFVLIQRGVWTQLSLFSACLGTCGQLPTTDPAPPLFWDPGLGLTWQITLSAVGSLCPSLRQPHYSRFSAVLHVPQFSAARSSLGSMEPRRIGSAVRGPSCLSPPLHSFLFYTSMLHG